MATKTMKKDITFAKRKETLPFVSALENSAKKSSKEIQLGRPVHNVKKKDIKSFFNNVEDV